MKNQVIELIKRPHGEPTQDTFLIKDIPSPELENGKVLLKSRYISLDPYMRSRMRDEKSYMPPFELNQPLSGGIVAEIVASDNDGYQPGQMLQGLLPWKRYQVADPEALQLVDPTIGPPSLALSTLGMTGLTAFFGLMDIGNPTKGETVVVSGAAGAVGSVVVQIAKIQGCRVVAIAGSDEKTAYLKKELGADEVINYKTADDLPSSIANASPDGVDVYFDNVGGTVSDAVIPQINQYARIVLCGQISLYNATTKPQGPRVAPLLVKRSALMKGFIITDYRDRIKEGIMQLAAWYQEGKLNHNETIVEGFEQLPKAFMRLFSGDKMGKLVVKV